MNDQPLWAPSARRVETSAMTSLRLEVNRRYGLDLPDSVALQRWSTENIDRFWDTAWDHVGVLGRKGDRVFVPGDSLTTARFFPDARLSVAANLVDGRGVDGDTAAILYRREDGHSEDLTWNQLRSQVAAAAAALAAHGVGAGDRVAAWMPNRPETVVLMIAAASLGAMFSSTSADFGVAGVVDRFGQIGPVLLLAADGYPYGGKPFDRREALAEIKDALPTLRRVVIVPNLDPEPDLTTLPGAISWSEFLAAGEGAELPTETFPFDHPLFILFSSGTTGPPKCIVHRAAGVMLKNMGEHQHQVDVRAGDRVFYLTTCGWMMWNWLVNALSTGASIVLYDGNPFHPSPGRLFDLIDSEGITLLGVSAKLVDAWRQTGLRPRETHRLDTLRTICSTGSPLSPEGFEWVYDEVAEDVHLASISGGTDLCGCFVGGDPTQPVWSGEIQGAALGMAVEVYDPEGRPVDGPTGELVCSQPFPSVPLRFWNDPGGAKFRAAYFERYPGVWTHGDYANWTPRGGMVIHGRSDATLNVAGVRIGTAEIYRQAEEVPGVTEAICVAQKWERDTRMVLFVRLDEGRTLTDDLVAEIKDRLRRNCSPRHVPAVVLETADIPRTRSGKITELAVTAVVNGEEVKNTEALANPEALANFADRAELA
nr:acetoacetate--CoA ligase [bacterium]